MDKNQQPGVSIGQIFLERAEFRHREDFLTLPPNAPLGNPTLLLEVQGGTSPDGTSGFVRATAKTNPESEPLYHLVVTMIALVAVEKGKENMPLDQYLRVSGPAMLFPFLREAVANLTTRGRFGPLWLAPVNIAVMASSEAKPPKASASKRRVRKSP